MDLSEQAKGAVHTVLEAAAARGEVRARDAEVQALLARGYRPPSVEGHRDEMGVLERGIVERLRSGNYAAIPPLLESLRERGAGMLAEARAWPELQAENSRELARVRERLAAASGYRQATALPAWEELRAYPEPNWSEVAGVADGSEAILQRVEALLAEAERLNGMEAQQFDRAGKLLVQAGKALEDLQAALTGVVQRLTAVREAEASSRRTLDATAGELAAVVGLLRSEGDKLTPEVRTRATEAERRLAEGRRLLQAGDFLAAMAALSAAAEAATTARRQASREVEEIASLRAQLDRAARRSRGNVEEALRRAGALPPGLLTAAVSAKSRQLREGLTMAERARMATEGASGRGALVESLRAGIAAFEAVDRLADQIRRDADTAIREEQRRRMMTPPMGTRRIFSGRDWSPPSGGSRPSGGGGGGFGSSGRSSSMGSSRRSGSLGSSGRSSSGGSSGRSGSMGGSRRR